MKIKTYYNQEFQHEGEAQARVRGTDYYCICNGLSGCGEASFDDNLDDDLSDEEQEELRSAAADVVMEHWNYDGSNWSEPVDEPESELTKEPDEDHKIGIARTEFHGGGVVGYAESEEDAEEWIKFLVQRTDCVCGCYDICVKNDPTGE